MLVLRRPVLIRTKMMNLSDIGSSTLSYPSLCYPFVVFGELCFYGLGGGLNIICFNYVVMNLVVFMI